MAKNNEEKKTRGEKTVASTLGYCKYCGTFFQIPAGEQDPGHCEKPSCIKKAGDINRIETSTTSGVIIVEFSGNNRDTNKTHINKMKVADNMFVMDIRKEHVYSNKELEELENEKKEISNRTTKTSKKASKVKKATSKSKKTNTKKVSKK